MSSTFGWGIPQGNLRYHPIFFLQAEDGIRDYVRLLEFRRVLFRSVLKTLEEVEAAVIERQPLWNNLKHERGPFDIIGDVHGCFDELVALLRQLGHSVDETAFMLQPADRRKVIFLGDLVDRGPKIAQVLKLAMNAVASGAALCV